MGGLTTKELPEEQSRVPKHRREGLLRAGTELQNRYRIEGTRGVGGFSSVYQARDMHFPNVTRLCAVKEMVHLSRDRRARELAAQSFEREASILATLDHPAVPDVYDFFTDGDRSYLVLEYIHGQDLEALLIERKEFIPTENVLDWALQLCDVLTYLHNHKPQPVIFRDLKPSNVMLDRHGRIRLIDFNIAKLFQAGVKGTMIGTEGYSPPEQYRGEASPAGDVYALGATLHHILTRQDPRTEPPFSFAERPIREVNTQVPVSLVAVIDRSLSYNVPDRYQEISEVHEALVRISAELGTGPLMSKWAENSKKAQRRKSAAREEEKPGTTPVWRFKCDDEIRSTAVVVNNIVYIGSYDNHLYSLKADSGELIWKHRAADGIAGAPFVYKNSILIGAADGFLYNLHRETGRLKWRMETAGPIYSSPRADSDHIFFGSDDGNLYAVNASSGRKVWQYNAHSAVRSTPLINEERVYFGTEGGYVFCLDFSGTVKWQFRARRSVTSSPVLAEDMIIVGSMDSTVYAVDANSGWALWRFRTRRPIVSTPAVADGTVFIGSSDGNLYALDLYSGRQVWVFETEAQINSSPTISDNAVYFGATDGMLYSLNVKRGKLRWNYETGNMIVASPTVDNSTVYVGSCDHYVYALPA
jgi:outer membrane protein assembly factor BamB/tRNA A-37 threonylcarbamoyl transferase component Bud32